jgi:hypothetical protein
MSTEQGPLPEQAETVSDQARTPLPAEVERKILL